MLNSEKGQPCRRCGRPWTHTAGPADEHWRCFSAKKRKDIREASKKRDKRMLRMRENGELKALLAAGIIASEEELSSRLYLPNRAKAWLENNPVNSEKANG